MKIEPTFDIATLLDWSEPRTVSTRKGERVLRTAAPDGQFWAAWRQEPVKAEMREAGISVGKDNGEWQVCWWSAPAKSISSGPANDSSAQQAAAESRDSTGIQNTARAGRDSQGPTADKTVRQAACSETIFRAGRSRRSAPEVAFAPSRESSASPVHPLSKTGNTDTTTDAGRLARENAPVAADPIPGGRSGESAQRSAGDSAPGQLGPQSIKPAGVPEGIVLSWEQLAIHAWFRKDQVALDEMLAEGKLKDRILANGNLVVEALAGTGKTFTVTYGFAQAPGDGDFYYLVFNVKNKNEALRKITDPRVTVTTLNACGWRFCRSVWRNAKMPDRDNPVDVDATRIDAVAPGTHEEAVTTVKRLIAFAKNTFVGVPTERELAALADERGVFCGLVDEEGQDEYPVARIAAIAKLAMQRALDVLESHNTVDFNDQVWLAVSKGWVRPISDLTVVDETQDMNLPQLVMVQKMTRKNGRTCVIGDRNQCIYVFRGAHPEGMDLMKTALHADVAGLTITRRCCKSVVRFVNPHVPHYRAADDAPEGTVDRLNEGDMNEQAKVGDAVLSRLNAPLMSTCLGLLRKGVPARIEGRDIGQQLVGMVKKLNAKSVPDFLRKLNHWGDKQKARLNVGKNGAAKCAAVDDQVLTLSAVAEGCANVEEIKARLLSLFQDSDENSRPAVVLSTVHKAKGLEWNRVFMLAWTFNRARKNQTPVEKREEANIHYVAATRAKLHLTLVSEGGKANTVKPVEGEVKAGAA